VLLKTYSEDSKKKVTDQTCDPTERMSHMHLSTQLIVTETSTSQAGSKEAYSEAH